MYNFIITGPPTHSVGGQTDQSVGVCRRLSSSSVTLHGGFTGDLTRAGQAMTSCRLQSDYSFTVTLHGGPVVLRPVMATPCLLTLLHFLLIFVIKEADSMHKSRNVRDCKNIF